VSEELLGSGIDKNIFEAINNVKKYIARKTFESSSLRGRASKYY
jgi:hypothetical protein